MKLTRIFVALNGILIIGFVIWSYLWLFVGAYYCNPNAEDLSLSVTARDEGFWQSIEQLLISYDGRYFTNVLHGINPLVFNSIVGYKLMPLLAIVLFIGSFFFLLKTLFVERRRGVLLLYAAVFTAVHFALTPSLPHDLYWMVSSFVYLYPWIFTFMWTGSFIRFIHEIDIPRRFLWFLATSFFLICCMGINEMFLIINTSFLFLILLYAIVKGRYFLLQTIPVLVIGFTCIIFFLSCPGIRERIASNRSPEGSFFYMAGIVQSVVDYGYTITHFFRSGMPIILLMYFTLNVREIQLKYKWHKERSAPLHQLVSIVAALSLCYAMSLAYYLPMQVEVCYPARIFNSVNVGFQIVLFVMVPLLLKTIIRGSAVSNLRVAFNFLLSLVLLFSIFFTHNNISQLYSEYSNETLQNYDAQMKLRYAVIDKVKGGDDAYKVAIVNQITNAPRSNYYGPDLTPNRTSSYWNGAYELYFGIDEIWLEEDSVIR